MTNLSPPPVRESDVTSQPWQKWFASVQMLLSPVATGGLMLWQRVSKLGSNITDIETRNHADLQNINSASYTHLNATNATDLTDGGESALHYHASDRDLNNATNLLLDANIQTVNANIGSFGDSTHTVAVTVDSKGRLTAVSQQAISFPSAVTSVTGTAPIVSSGGTTPAISIAAASASVNGYLTSVDWTSFNGKYSPGGALGTPSSGTVTNLTGTASININGSVGATTPSTGKFTTITASGLITPQQATTAGAPAYVKGVIYFDTTLNKMRVGGATAWETITSI